MTTTTRAIDGLGRERSLESLISWMPPPRVLLRDDVRAMGELVYEREAEFRAADAELTRLRKELGGAQEQDMKARSDAVRQGAADPGDKHSKAIEEKIAAAEDRHKIASRVRDDQQREFLELVARVRAEWIPEAEEAERAQRERTIAAFQEARDAQRHLAEIQGVQDWLGARPGSTYRPTDLQLSFAPTDKRLRSIIEALIARVSISRSEWLALEAQDQKMSQSYPIAGKAGGRRPARAMPLPR